MTVLGSGDQYFASKLFGAKRVEVFDCNPNAWPFFAFKFYTIRILSYEEFCTLLKSHFSIPHLFAKVIKYVPHDILVELKKILKDLNDFSSMLIYSPLSRYYNNFNTDRTIPYLDKKHYYILQGILRESTLPRMHFKNLLDMPESLDGATHDILLTSNAYKWLIMTPKEYDLFLSKFKVKVIQHITLGIDTMKLRTFKVWATK